MAQWSDFGWCYAFAVPLVRWMISPSACMVSFSNLVFLLLLFFNLLVTGCTLSKKDLPSCLPKVYTAQQGTTGPPFTGCVEEAQVSYISELTFNILFAHKIKV